MSISTRILKLAGAAALGGWAYGLYHIRRFEDLTPGSPDAPGAYLKVDGARIHYVEAGAGEPVVLIHGWNGCTYSYRYTIPELARHFRVVALDLRGYGHSDRSPRGDYSVAGQAALVRVVMQRLGIERAAVVGHSMGGGIALRLAADEPERVTRLVLVDSASGDEVRRARRLGWLVRPLLPLVAFALRRSFVLRTLRRVVHDPARVTPETLEGYLTPLRMKGHFRAAMKQLADRRRDTPAEPERIAQETLILWGEHDRVIPLERGEELARRIPHAALVVVRGAGHLPLEEEPEVCNRELLQFLMTAAASAAGAEAAGDEAPSSPELSQPHRRGSGFNPTATG
jgi:pimeloyl-ACP methyl ester carboxylesterase